jgi:DNA-binding transcriptional ArsR family regulator
MRNYQKARLVTDLMRRKALAEHLGINVGGVSNGPNLSVFCIPKEGTGMAPVLYYARTEEEDKAYLAGETPGQEQGQVATVEVGGLTFVIRSEHARALDALLSKTRQGILAATLVQPEKAWYVSELARRMGVPSSSLQRELRDLKEAGILNERRQGRMVYYQANTNSPIFPELRGLMLKTVGFVDVLRNATAPIADKLQVVFVHGSIASGREQSQSDVDLMVIGKVAPVDLAVALRKARELLNREINPTIYSPAEFAKKRASKDHFLTRVLDKPKLFVLGSDDDLEKIAG